MPGSYVGTLTRPAMLLHSPIMLAILHLKSVYVERNETLPQDCQLNRCRLKHAAGSAAHC